jgi:hypothetical protein
VRDYYVRVVAPEPLAAKRKFDEQFLTPWMNSSDDWSGMYTEQHFDDHKRSFYPKGEYLVIR